MRMEITARLGTFQNQNAEQQKSGMNRFKNFKIHLCLRKKTIKKITVLYNLTGTVKNTGTVNSKCL